ncbi:ppx/gppa phosphatase [Lucifera butyrica]|uniref:Ppx/gppa phosphatase n=1 Tax=Lucifera butyrica TaxID=1351585 RepID=A0A498R4N3_9FIRM|nr:Ppx/GppA phosphatase family protein [Lucifera butyrica]VBB06404.1 ppx/gppa phosphatase [Lucifera butyrica]
MIRAAIDIGTNSVRLLVADVREGILYPLYREMATTRLGTGVHKTGKLGREPMHNTAAAVAGMVAQAQDRGARNIVVVATSAVRDAVNRKEFLQLCYDVAGVEVSVLSGPEEARLSYTGAVYGENAKSRFLVIDIGGGSTEMVLGRNGELEEAISLDIGAVRLSELFPAGTDGTVPHLDTIRDYVIKQLAVTSSWERPGRMLGVGGTTTSLAAMEQHLPVYDSSRVQGYYLSLATVRAWLTRLAAMTLSERGQVAGLQSKRADIIVYGIVILVCILEYLAMDEIMVSEQDILEGIIITG